MFLLEAVALDAYTEDYLSSLNNASTNESCVGIGADTIERRRVRGLQI